MNKIKFGSDMMGYVPPPPPEPYYGAPPPPKRVGVIGTIWNRITGRPPAPREYGGYGRPPAPYGYGGHPAAPPPYGGGYAPPPYAGISMPGAVPTGGPSALGGLPGGYLARPGPMNSWARWQLVHPGVSYQDYVNWWNMYGAAGASINGDPDEE